MTRPRLPGCAERALANLADAIRKEREAELARLEAREAQDDLLFDAKACGVTIAEAVDYLAKAEGLLLSPEERNRAADRMRKRRSRRTRGHGADWTHIRGRLLQEDERSDDMAETKKQLIRETITVREFESEEIEPEEPEGEDLDGADEDEQDERPAARRPRAK